LIFPNMSKIEKFGKKNTRNFRSLSFLMEWGLFYRLLFYSKICEN
jgi:hypothetical protein